MRLFAPALLALVLAGCASRQPGSSPEAQQTALAEPQTASRDSSPSAAGSSSVHDRSAQPQPSSDVSASAQPLPFKGRLADGDASDVPPSVALSLSGSSPIVFSYWEELTHDEYHIPLWFSAIDPVTYLGSPLGDYGVSAFASLSITDGERVLGDYTAKVHVSKSYNLYSEPTHQELEQAARTAVRARIDEKLHRDADRLAREIGAASAPATRPAGQ
jgi:hypothetical protein